MRFWAREVAGWLLVGLSLGVFYICFVLLLNHYVLEGGPLTLVGIILFRGGIHLLKVAVAARVCQQALERVEARPVPALVVGRRRPLAARG
ncbi:MAG: hypothetical protein L0Z62_38350 [Gemmataceae bacterium]|nr:hypothetical protein [Gemmataceae bacterium]